MKKNGFTLIELLATIVILGVFSVMQKFGPPEKQCTENITYKNGKNSKHISLRWYGDKSVLVIHQLPSNNDPSVYEYPLMYIMTKDWAKLLDSGKINNFIKNIDVDCTKYSPPASSKQPDKDGF